MTCVANELAPLQFLIHVYICTPLSPVNQDAVKTTHFQTCVASWSKVSSILPLLWCHFCWNLHILNNSWAPECSKLTHVGFLFIRSSNQKVPKCKCNFSLFWRHANSWWINDLLDCHIKVKFAKTYMSSSQIHHLLPSPTFTDTLSTNQPYSYVLQQKDTTKIKYGKLSFSIMVVCLAAVSLRIKQQMYWSFDKKLQSGSHSQILSEGDALSTGEGGS